MGACALLDIETGTTATTTRCSWITDNLELTPYQLRSEIDGTPLQQLQTWLIHHNLCLRSLSTVLEFEYRIFFRIYLLGRLEGHQVLETMTSASCDRDTEM